MRFVGNGEVSRGEFRGSYVRYRAMRIALGLRSALPDVALDSEGPFSVAGQH